VSTVTATTSSINSDVSSQTTKAVTTDYSSPKLGGRSLGAKKKYAPSGRTNKGDEDEVERPRSDSDKENSHGGGGGGGGASTTHTIQANNVAGLGIHKANKGGDATHDEQQQEEHVELVKAGLTPQLKARFKTGDLLAHTPAYKIGTANQVMPDQVGSPAQLQSRLSLLNLAKDVPENRVESPKPTYLRRLDSPQTHLGKLIQKKSDLEALIRKALAEVPHITDWNEFATIKSNFLEAVLLLEASTATDSSSTMNHQ